MSDTFVPKTPPGKASPWEQMWGADKPKEKPPVVAPKQAATTDGSWDEINKKYAQGKPERDKAQLTILQNELASVTDPKHKAILQREIDRVGGDSVDREGKQARTGDIYADRRQEFEALPKVSAKEVLDTGFNKLDARNAWVDKMEAEYKDALKGKTAAQKDKMWSNSWYFAKEKHPKEAAAFMHFHNQGTNEDIPVNAKSFLQTYNPDMSFVSLNMDSRGWVYKDNGDRIFMTDGDTNTMVHEAEHIRQRQDLKKYGDNAPHTAFTRTRAYSEPINELMRWTNVHGDEPEIKQVFRAANAHDNPNEWLANLQAFYKTGIPEGKSWSDTGFYKKLVTAHGKEKAQTMMLDALMVLQRAPYTFKDR